MIREFEQADLTLRNSFRISQRAARLVEFQTPDDLAAFFSAGIPEKWQVLSGGNNILFTRDYDGVLLTPVSHSIAPTGEDADRVLVRAEAGVEWDDLARWAAGQGLWGIENLSLIPGKVGAAPVQNIGAYGVEAGDVIHSVEVFSVDTCKQLVLSGSHCAFGYRDSVFKHTLRGRAIITAVTFALSRKPLPRLGYGDLLHEVEARGGATLANIREAVCSIRRSKLPDPALTGNAGSFFKNPVVDLAVADDLRRRYPDMPLYPSSEGPRRVKLAAGWMIDRCGLKGYRAGRAGVHDRQALVLVNLGGATGSEVLALARHVQQCVAERFGVAIDTEVNIL